MTLPVEWWPCLELAGLLALESALVIAVAAGLQRCTHRAQAHRAIWHAAVVSAVVLVACEFTGLGRALPAFAREWVKPTSALGPSTARVGWPPTASDAALQLKPAFRAQVAERLKQRSLPTTPASGNRSQPRSASEILGPADAAVEPFLEGPSTPWPPLVWILGAIAALGPMWLARLCWFAFHRRQRGVFEGELLDRVARLAGRVGLHRRVRVFDAARLSGPVAFGILRPTIGLPNDFARRFSPVQQEVMLAHELAHLAGHDPAWQALADFLAALLWWNPLAWWLRHRLHAAAEAAADESSLLVTDGPAVLAECLVQLASDGSPQRPLAWMGVAGQGFRSGLGKRIERLLSLKQQSWTPRHPFQTAAINLVASAALVTTAILCTAWAAPHRPGEPMKTLKQTWKRSLATLALFASIGTDQAAAQIPAANPPQTAPAQNTPTDPRYARYAQFGVPAPAVGSNQPPAENDPATQEQQPDPSSIYKMDPRLLERYGLIRRSTNLPTARASVPLSRGKQQVENKLEQITLDDVLYDNLPLKEVVRDLNDQARRRDPEKRGINFLISNTSEAAAASPGFDPTTGIPLPAPPATMDMASVTIRLHLRDVRLKDVIDAMARLAEPRVKYSIEDYGVVFSPGGAPVQPALETARLQVRTFRVDTNTFLPGLESAFGISVPRRAASAASGLPEKTARIKLGKAEEDLKLLHNTSGIPEEQLNKAKYDVELAKAELEATQSTNHDIRTASSRDVQDALRQLLQQLGINLDAPNKAVFYNGLTGIIFVRATPEDLELVQAAIETLGGRALREDAKSAVVGHPPGVGL